MFLYKYTFFALKNQQRLNIYISDFKAFTLLASVLTLGIIHFYIKHNTLHSCKLTLLRQVACRSATFATWRHKQFLLGQSGRGGTNNKTKQKRQLFFHTLGLSLPVNPSEVQRGRTSLKLLRFQGNNHFGVL